MRVAILLFCFALAFGQDTSTAPETKPQTPASSADQKQQPTQTSPNNSFSKYAEGMTAGSAIQQASQAAAAHASADRGRLTPGAVDILSDTEGVDFGPYLRGMLKNVRENWYHLIPQQASTKKGKLAIEFAITKDGRVADMRLVASSGDAALDRPAWDSIAGSNPFPPLPSEFKGQFLKLRFRFYYNPDKSDLGGPIMKPPPEPAIANGATPIPSKSGIAVSISSLGDIYVPAGGSKTVTATVTGTKEQTVEWSVRGLGCSASPCGNITGDLYIAPTVQPSPAVVTLTATSKADPTAKATVNVHIVAPFPKLASEP
jgi:TonB family protein